MRERVHPRLKVSLVTNNPDLKNLFLVVIKLSEKTCFFSQALI